MTKLKSDLLVPQLSSPGEETSEDGAPLVASPSFTPEPPNLHVFLFFPFPRFKNILVSLVRNRLRTLTWKLSSHLGGVPSWRPEGASERMGREMQRGPAGLS